MHTRKHADFPHLVILIYSLSTDNCRSQVPIHETGGHRSLKYRSRPRVIISQLRIHYADIHSCFICIRHMTVLPTPNAQAGGPHFTRMNYVRREHASLQIHTPVKPHLSACTLSSPFTRSVRDACVCRTANDADPSYKPATDDALVQLDIIPDICTTSTATNNDNNPSECPSAWSEMIDDWWRRAVHRWTS